MFNCLKSKNMACKKGCSKKTVAKKSTGNKYSCGGKKK